MQVEPLLDRSQLAQILGRTYGFGVADLTFVRTGWISACYTLLCHDGSRRFLKLQPLSGPQATAASSPDFYLPLTHRLHATGLLPAIAYPLSTKSGQWWTTWEGWRVILHQHIDGRVVGHDGITDAILAQLAGLVGRLHRSLPALDLQVRSFDRFEIPFESELMGGLTALEVMAPEETWGQKKLRDLLLPRRDEVLSVLQWLPVARDRAKMTEDLRVICHTDLHGENLMLDDSGQLYIVDWEGTVLAPREHDLFMFAEEPRFRDVFLPAYEAETGPISLNVDGLTFYSLRRWLEDLTDWILRLEAGVNGDAQDADDLRELEDMLAEVPVTVV